MKTYTQDDIHMMAENALNAAILSIQDELGQTDGGIAGIYFSGIREDAALSILKSYIQTEINFAKQTA
jgi:hypothetical protein